LSEDSTLTRPDGPARRHGARARADRRGHRVGIASLAVAIVSAVIAFLAWRLPVPPEPGPDGTAPPSTAVEGTRAPVATGGATTPAAIPLDRLVVQSGRPNIDPLPRSIADNPAYAGGIAIACPTNQNDDPIREIVFSLKRRYLDLAATIRPYTPEDPAARAEVILRVGLRQRDGSLRQVDRARHLGATSTTPGRIAATVDDAEEATVSVRCEAAGHVLLVGTATPA